jgi:hypothetical protein
LSCTGLVASFFLFFLDEDEIVSVEYMPYTENSSPHRKNIISLDFLKL